MRQLHLKKNPKQKTKKPKKKKKKKKIYAGVAKLPPRPPRLDFFYFIRKICDEGILGRKKRSKWLNCNNLKVWGG
jgi:hypothetical protein